MSVTDSLPALLRARFEQQPDSLAYTPADSESRPSQPARVWSQLVAADLRSATTLWNYPTPASLSAYLAKRLTPQAESHDEVAPDSSSHLLDALFDRVESAPAAEDSIS
jgi:hypothetical protein